MPKKNDYTTKALTLIAKGRKYAKYAADATDEVKNTAIVDKELEFARAYTKLCRTPDACVSWAKALLEAGAPNVVADVFDAKRVVLDAADPQITIDTVAEGIA